MRPRPRECPLTACSAHALEISTFPHQGYTACSGVALDNSREDVVDAAIDQTILSIRCKDSNAHVIQHALTRARYKFPHLAQVALNVEDCRVRAFANPTRCARTTSARITGR
ncbi:hypothetical protein EXIGLDRAFT_139214 [Exidia glandulosa HHB12029]|uniref:Uncharacterized protein n=1 Tax=Exidia glandulosa HHB12029 TaxID=1314781 RepID=A0A165FZ63_EXIGL|nr:hypothetical protein EXIGLDRAFT_139214 [Exidia glandulosa HHB12029]